MPETFSIVFCSRNSNVVDATSLNAVKYNVNWSAILPKKYKKFLCEFIFKSENTATQLTSNGFIGMDFGRVNVFDGLQINTRQLGIIYPVACGNQYFYNSTNNDNNPFYIDYPSNSTVTVLLNTFAGASIGNMQNYCLMVNMTGIDDYELKDVYNSSDIRLK
jgi:hypothetical protein